MKHQSTINLLFMILFLTGCKTPSDSVAPFVCLTGACSSTEERLAAIPWFPSKLEKESCQSIDGEYKEIGWIGNNKESQESLFRKFDFRLHRDDKNKRGVGMQADYEIYKKIPYVPIELGMTYDSETKAFTKKFSHDESAFYKRAVTSIKRKENQLEVVLMDEKGSEYEKSVLALDHPQIGCIDGAFAIRTMSIGSGGIEGAYGLAYTTEIKSQKLPDGSLQIAIQTREWYYTSSRGLIGISASGRASGTEPRKSEVKLTFPARVGRIP